MLAPPLRDEKALVIPANGPARLETTPAEPPFLSTEVVELKGQVSELGKLTGHARLVLRGDAEMYFRMIFRRTPKSNWKELGYLLASAVGVRGEASDIKPGDLATLEKPFELEYNFSSDDFLDWSSKKAKLGIPLPQLHLMEVCKDSLRGNAGRFAARLSQVGAS